MLMIACSGMALVLAEGSYNGPRPKAEGHYGCQKVMALIHDSWVQQDHYGIY